VIAKTASSLKEVSSKRRLDIQQLRAWNPHIKADSVKKHDTVFLVMRNARNPTVKPTAGGQSSSSSVKNALYRTINYNGKQLFICEVNPHKYKIEAYNQQDNGRGVHDFNSLARLKKRELILAVNGGMFEQDLSPLGLFVSDGTTYGDVNLRRDGHGNFYDFSHQGIFPNAIFLIDSTEKAFIIPSDHYARRRNHPRIATQSGPILVIKDAINEHFREGSENLQIRNGVGVNKHGNVLFVVSLEPVNFHEFASLFRDELHCPNALYLDGFVSQYYVPALHGAQRQTRPTLGVFLTVSNRAPTQPATVVSKKDKEPGKRPALPTKKPPPEISSEPQQPIPIDSLQKTFGDPTLKPAFDIPVESGVVDSVNIPKKPPLPNQG
jgi:uncharacterized protein YigE (DUF2233 family)